MTNWDNEWAALLDALCADDASRIGTVGPPDGELTPVRPTRFRWLDSLDWWPAGHGTGIAVLELTEPGTVPAEAWEPLCGPLREARVTREGHVPWRPHDGPPYRAGSAARGVSRRGGTSSTQENA